MKLSNRLEKYYIINSLLSAKAWQINNIYLFWLKEPLYEWYIIKMINYDAFDKQGIERFMKRVSHGNLLCKTTPIIQMI